MDSIPRSGPGRPGKAPQRKAGRKCVLLVCLRAVRVVRSVNVWFASCAVSSNLGLCRIVLIGTVSCLVWWVAVLIDDG